MIKAHRNAQILRYLSLLTNAGTEVTHPSLKAYGISLFRKFPVPLSAVIPSHLEDNSVLIPITKKINFAWLRTSYK